MRTQWPRVPTRLPGRLGGSWADRLEVLVPSLGYAAATLTGASTSSLGIALLRQDPTAPLGRQVGGPRAIRSDEWLTQAPIELGVLARGSSSHSPLAQSPDLIYQTSDGGVFESVLFLDGTVLRLGPWLPDAVLFAAYRALPLLLLLLALPPLLRRLGATRPMSWLAVVLIVLAPATMWWSFMPTRILGFASAGSYLLILARDRLAAGPGRSRWLGLALAALAGGALARLATYYVPWSLVVGVPLAAATVAWLLWPREHRRPGLVAVGVGAVVGAVLLAGMWWDNLDALRAELATLYPGSRRASGQPEEPFLLLGAPGLFEAQNGPAPVLYNTSEITSAFTVCAAWALMLVLGLRSPVATPQERAGRAARWVLGGALLVWTAWTTLPWGELGQRIPVLNLVMPIRATQTMGYLAALLVVLQLSRLRPGGQAARAAVAAVACTGLTLLGTRDLQHALLSLSTAAVVGVSALTGLLVYAVTRWPRSPVPVIAVALAAAAGVARVNPIVFGLGDLRASQTATALRGYAADGTAAGRPVLFAADDSYLSAVLVANGVPSLTGYQVTGPVRQQWAKLDPTGQFEPVWNRGASYLRIGFDGPAGSPAAMTNPSGDVISVIVDPCTLGRDFGVTHLLVSRRPAATCLREAATLRWNGQPVYVLELTAP